MNSQQLTAFTLSQPFVPFTIHLVNDRIIHVAHPEQFITATAGLGLWLFYDDGKVEAIAAEAIVSLITRDAIDPHELIGEQ